MKDFPAQNAKAETHLNRRTFLTTTSAAVAGGALLGFPDISRSAFVNPDDTLKIALVGCGGRGSGAANQALKTSGKVKLVAMADAFPDKLGKSLADLKHSQGDLVDVPPENQFTGFDAYKKAIALADVVILATPPGFRPIHFEEAVNQGKHVFLEKPVAVDAPGVRQVLAAAEIAKQKNLKVGVGMQRRHQAGYIEALKRLHDGAIGEIVAMRCYWCSDNGRHYERKPGETEMEYQMRIWYFFIWLSGDHIVEQHVHNLDVINWVKQSFPVKARGMGGRQVRKGPQFGQIWDHHCVEFEYADGSHLISECRQMHNVWSDVSEHAVGTLGKADLTDGRSWNIAGKNPWKMLSVHQKDPYQQEHDDLFNAIRNNKPYNEAEYGAKSTMTAILGRMCTYTGQEITWDRAINSQISLAPARYAWDALPQPLPDKDGNYPVPVPGDPEWIKKII